MVVEAVNDVLSLIEAKCFVSPGLFGIHPSFHLPNSHLVPHAFVKACHSRSDYVYSS